MERDAPHPAYLVPPGLRRAYGHPHADGAPAGPACRTTAALTLRMADGKPFAFSALPYTPHQLESAAHADEAARPRPHHPDRDGSCAGRRRHRQLGHRCGTRLPCQRAGRITPSASSSSCECKGPHLPGITNTAPPLAQKAGGGAFVFICSGSLRPPTGRKAGIPPPQAAARSGELRPGP